MFDDENNGWNPKDNESDGRENDLYGENVVGSTGVEYNQEETVDFTIADMANCTADVADRPEATEFTMVDTFNSQAEEAAKNTPYTVNYNYSNISDEELRERRRRELQEKRSLRRETRLSGGNSDDPDSFRRKGSSEGKKIASIAFMAVVFGLVAGVCFQGVNYLFNGGKHPIINNSGPIATMSPIQNQIAENNGNVTAIKDVSSVVENTMPSIVAITSTVESEGIPFFGGYYGGGESTGSGSGIIVGQNDNELLLVTNNHVVQGAKKISVQFIDDEVYTADVKGSDPTADLAVVTVKLKDIKESTKNKIKVAALGDSASTKVGEMVVAIGNALGYGQSVTVGYISAKDREITIEGSTRGSSSKMTLLQTDAAINPGNSGGALLNMSGQVVGINSIKYASAEIEGMGYAIPITTATPIINELVKYEALKEGEKGYLGISGRTVTDEAAIFDMPQGVYVDDVAKGSAADKAGVLSRDIITKINDISVNSIEALQQRVTSYKQGTVITVTVMRVINGQYEEKTLETKLQGASSVDSLKSDEIQSGDSQQKDESEQFDPDGIPDENRDYYDDFFGDSPFSDWFR